MAVPMPKEPETPQTLEQVMPSLTAALIEAFNRGDLVAFMKHCADDASMLMADRPPIVGREAIEAALKEFFDAKAKILEVEPIEVLSLGELGYAAGTYRMETPSGDGAAAIAETGKFVTIYRLQADGSWKVIVDSMIGDTAAA